MTNPFLKPHSVGEWLRSSLCWTGTCLGSLLLGWFVLPAVLPVALGNLIISNMPPGVLVAHVLIWRHAVMGGRAIIRHDEAHYDLSLTRVAAHLWLIVLMLFQLACLLTPIILLGLLGFSMWGAPSSPPSGEPFFG
ncbi:hypothetical protein GCM10023172_06630 [Hymenobacter ginsengisoli]|uniref:Uncharacterized protein n=1 Tax=Hymenobacter ginsengisoli TaxID=1051626 RepID=A0ABP8Q2B3_9BACT|nr:MULTISPECIES: hypothetical protein [unclassified Hymenobacter]MBO2032687.1 hypothetical protein [Hymenobacter sp. BT559]